MTAGPDSVTATVAVKVPLDPTAAFALFTTEMDAWWRRGPKYRHATTPDAEIRLEATVGGRVYERWTEGGAPRELELGRVEVCEPPDRLVFSWRNATFAAAERTSVEVTFAAVTRGTVVTVTHRGWTALRPDHPARHGLDDRGVRREVGLWWGGLVAALRERAAES